MWPFVFYNEVCQCFKECVTQSTNIFQRQTHLPQNHAWVKTSIQAQDKPMNLNIKKVQKAYWYLVSESTFQLTFKNIIVWCGSKGNCLISFIYVFLAVLGSCCCTWHFSSYAEQGYSLVAGSGFSLWWILARACALESGFSSCSRRA